MKICDRYIIHISGSQNGASLKVRDKDISRALNVCSASMTVLSKFIFFEFCSRRDVKLQHSIMHKRFLDYSEDEWTLNCMIDNVPQKYLKFIVGLYKLHTNQISTSELEQLVLDNIEDLL